MIPTKSARFGVAALLVFPLTFARADNVYFTHFGADLDGSGYAFFPGSRPLSADGRIAVGSQVSYYDDEEAFRWQAGQMTLLGGFGGQSATFPISRAAAVSADGTIIAGTGYSHGYRPEAAVWNESGQMIGLGLLPGQVGSSATGMSASGDVIVGSGGGAYDIHAFRWSAATGMVGLDGLPEHDESLATAVSGDGRFVVGDSMSNARGVQACRWVDGVPESLGWLPGGEDWTHASNISRDGSTVVGAAGIGWTLEAFRWMDGKMSGLGYLPGFLYSEAEAVSADGSIVVGMCGAGPDGALDAFIWDRAHGMRSLRELLTQDYGLDLNGWTELDASGISDAGDTFVGMGRNPDGHYEAWIAHIPEPSSAALFAGVASMALMRRYRCGTCSASLRNCRL